MAVSTVLLNTQSTAGVCGVPARQAGALMRHSVSSTCTANSPTARPSGTLAPRAAASTPTTMLNDRGEQDGRQHRA